MFKKLLYAVLVSFLVIENAESSEPVLSQVIPRIPSENRCQLAKKYVEQMLLPIEDNLANYKILGNCALKKNKLEAAFSYWSKAALLGDQSSMANIGRTSAINDFSSEKRAFGLKILAQLGEKDVKEKYLSKLFAALSLIAYPDNYQKKNKREVNEVVALLLIQAVGLEKKYDMTESLMIVNYLLRVDYFEKRNFNQETKNQISMLAKDADPHFCYMHEALLRDVYKLPRENATMEFYKTQCDKMTIKNQLRNDK